MLFLNAIHVIASNIVSKFAVWKPVKAVSALSTGYPHEIEKTDE